jgi:plasmid stabilization system protein ParE
LKVEIFPQAEADIIRQFRYYLADKDAPKTAVRFREAVIDTLEQLKPNPRIGSLLAGSTPGLRSWQVKGFEAIRIYYVEGPGRLRVVRILHAKRNIRRILRDEDPPRE